MNILEQANQKVVEINRLMKEVENYEGIIEGVKNAKVCFSESKIGTTWLDSVLSPEQMDGLKLEIINLIRGNYADKESKLLAFIGVEPKPEVVIENKSVRKAATINPEFEEAVKEMEASNKKANTDEDVRRLYFDEGMTLAGVCKQLRISQKTFYQILDRNGWQTRPRVRR